MGYQADEEVLRLIARSDKLSEQSRSAQESGARTSDVLKRALAQSNDVCAMSERLYTRPPEEEAEAPEESEAESGHVS